MLDQMHIPPTVVSVVSALLEHPEFQYGLDLAQELFLEYYEEAPLTEEEMLELVESEVSRAVTERDKQFWHAKGWQAPAYLRSLGFVFGIINQGLTYPQ